MRPLDAGGGLHEDDGLFRDGRTGLGRVVGVVQTNRHKLSNASHRATHAGFAAHGGQFGGVELAQLGEHGVAELSRPEVRYHRTEVAQCALCIDQTRFFLSGLAISNQFHETPFVSVECLGIGR